MSFVLNCNKTRIIVLKSLDRYKKVLAGRNVITNVGIIDYQVVILGDIKYSSFVLIVKIKFSLKKLKERVKWNVLFFNLTKLS